MKRTIFAVSILVSVVALLALSHAALSQVKDTVWDLIPDAQKAHLITRNYDGTSDLSIMCYAATEQTMQILDWEPSPSYFLGGNCMMVYVASYDGGYFWPTEFDFTQGHTQYEISYGDYLEISGPFSGGQLRSGTTAIGAIRIPPGIDPSRVFTIWYGDDSEQLGPMHFVSKGLIYIEGMTQQLQRLAMPYLTDWIINAGYLPTKFRNSADYRVALSATKAEASRRFNWWFLLCPCWPFMPVSTVQASVEISVTVSDDTGTQILSSSLEGEASIFLIADLFSRDWTTSQAFKDALLQLARSVSLP